MVLIANDCGYKIFHFWANPQKYQTLVPAKNSHLKVCECSKMELSHHIIVGFFVASQRYKIKYQLKIKVCVILSYCYEIGPIL